MAEPTIDPVDALIDRIAEAVVRKIDEKEKIDTIAQAVLAELIDRQASAPGAAAGRQASPQPAQQADTQRSVTRGQSKETPSPLAGGRRLTTVARACRQSATALCGMFGKK